MTTKLAIPKACECVPCGPSPRCAKPDDIEKWQKRQPSVAEIAVIEMLEAEDLSTLSIMHVGIGCGLFESRLAGRCARLDAITLNPLEVEVIHNDKRLGGVTAFVADKNRRDTWCGEYDVIVDVDLLAYCCCWRHLYDLLYLMAGALRYTGRIVTAAHAGRLSARFFEAKQLGEPWLPELSRDDLVEVAANAGLTAEWTGDICTMRRIA